MLNALAERGRRRSLTFFAHTISAGRRATAGAFGRARDAGGRLIVIDPGLDTPGGHHFEFARLIDSNFASERSVTFYAHAAAGPTIAATVDARPIFRDSIYSPLPAGPFARVFDDAARSMADALKNVDPADLRSDTIALMHTTTACSLGALARWYASLRADQRPKLLVQFQFPLEFMIEPPAEWPAVVGLARDAARALASLGMVHFAANSTALAARIEAQLGMTCTLLPIPVRWPKPATVRTPDRDPVFGFFGGLRREKGAAVLARAIAEFAQGYPDTRYIVHAPASSDEEAVRVLARVPQVELLRTTFARKEQYFAEFRRVRWLLLPYDPARYAIRTSGVFIEALGLGIPVVVTEGTWMAAELRERAAAGLVMREYRAAELHDCLAQARLAMLADAGPPCMPNPALMAEHSPAQFCAEVLRLMTPRLHDEVPGCSKATELR